jgi:hypothetical protein
LDLLAGLDQATFECGLTPECVGSGGGANLHTVLGDLVECDEVVVEQDGDSVGEQVVEPVVVLDPEVGECVVVHRDTSAEPLVSGVAVAESVEFVCTSDAIDGGVEPECKEDAGIDVGMSGSMLCGLDGVVEV